LGVKNQFRELSMEYSRLGPLVERYRRFTALERDSGFALELASDKDPATRTMGEEELADLAPRIAAEELELQRLLVPKDPHDDSNIFLKSAPAPAATRPPSLPATCSACTRAMPNPRAGASRS